MGRSARRESNRGDLSFVACHDYAAVIKTVIPLRSTVRSLTKYVTEAATKCASLRNKRVSPHVLRHTAAMELLRHGVDRTVIALWLGHESVETTHVYLHADLNLKEQALAKTSALGLKPGRFRADDDLVAFLEAL